MDASERGAILDLIYDAAAAPEAWVPLLKRLADRLGGNSAWLSRLDLATGAGTGITARIDPVMPRLYAEHYAPLNPFTQQAGLDARQRAWTSGVIESEAMLEDRQLERGEYYNDFMRPQDVHSVLVFRLVLEGGTSVAVNINRPRRRGAFSAGEMADARSLLGHLRRAVRLGDRLAQSRALHADLTAALELSPEPSLVVDAEARVRFANPAALALAARDGGLRLHGGRLSADGSDATRRLHTHIARAACADPELRRGATLALPAGEDRLPLAVSVWPLPSREPVIPAGPGAVLVTCVDPCARATPALAALREVFGLTPAEAAVAAAFCEGATPREIAARLGVGFNTVRFHLARIFAKTGVGRQAELALMFAQLSRLPH